MKKKHLINFLKNELKNIKISDWKNNKSFIFLNSIYIFIAFFLIISSTTNIKQILIPINSLTGILTQLQVIILLYLILNFITKGFIAALILTVFSIFSVTAVMIFESNMSYIPDIIAYFTVLIIMYFIYNYQKEIELKVAELKKEKKKLKYMAYYDNLTEIANREMLIDRLDYLSSMSESESINYKLIFIDFKNFKKINDSWG